MEWELYSLSRFEFHIKVELENGRAPPYKEFIKEVCNTLG